MGKRTSTDTKAGIYTETMGELETDRQKENEKETEEQLYLLIGRVREAVRRNRV